MSPLIPADEREKLKGDNSAHSASLLRPPAAWVGDNLILAMAII